MAVRYLFRGLIRDTGKPVEGHVEADHEEFAFHVLANNGIVTESLRPDPKPEDLRPASSQPVRANLLPPLAQAMLPGNRPSVAGIPMMQTYTHQGSEHRGPAMQSYE